MTVHTSISTPRLLAVLTAVIIGCASFAAPGLAAGPSPERKIAKPRPGALCQYRVASSRGMHARIIPFPDSCGDI